MLRHFLVVFIFLFSFSCYSADVRDQINIQTGKAELVIPNMQPQDVANNIKEAISQFAIPANLNFRTQPSEIPVRPEEPISKQIYIQGAPAIEYQCKTAYAEINKRPPPVQNPFYFNAEFLQACLYSFQKGVKVYLIFTIAKKTESITSGLFNMITKTIRGDDADRISEQLKENIASIRKNIPSVLVERLEVPGKALDEPDKLAVAALIPQRIDSSSPVTQKAPVSSVDTPSPVDLSFVGSRKELSNQAKLILNLVPNPSSSSLILDRKASFDHVVNSRQWYLACFQRISMRLSSGL